MAKSGKTSPWVYVGLGCLGAAVLAVAVVVGLGFAGWRWARGLEEQMKDPESREARVLEVLGAERVPDGYYAVMAMEIPFLMEMAMLSDHPVEIESEDGGEIDLEADDLGERGLIYFEMPGWGDEPENLDDFLAGRSDDAEFLRRSSIDLQRGAVIARGEVPLPGADRARFVAQRGSIGGHRHGEARQGLTCTLSVECPGDERIRLALWFGPDPDAGPDPTPGPEAAPNADRLAGSVADPQEVSSFFAQFRFCG